MEELAKQVGLFLKEKGWKLVVAESCTGGGVSESITSVAGSSAWFDRGFITYSNQAKIDMLGVNVKTIETFGAVSKETVLEMSVGALQRSSAQLSVAISGIAGPDGGTPDKPVGTVWIAWAGRAGQYAQPFVFEGDRQKIRAQAIDAALKAILAAGNL